MANPNGVTFAQEWGRAWNRRDLDALLSHYAEDVEFSSLLVPKILGGSSGTIRGKQELREYFQKALAAFPGELGLEITAVYEGAGSVVVLFEAKGRKGAELMELNAENLVCRALAHGLSSR